MKFEITGRDCEHVKKFTEQHKDCPMKSLGEKFAYTFIPTGIGIAITVSCTCGQKILLGDIVENDTEEYDEERYKVLTQEDIDNQNFEEAVMSILHHKNPRTFQMIYSCEQNFEMIYTHAIKVARKSDERISNAILYKNTFENEEENYTGTDEEKIQRFFSYFEECIRKEIEKYHCTNQSLMSLLAK